MTNETKRISLMAETRMIDDVPTLVHYIDLGDMPVERVMDIMNAVAIELDLDRVEEVPPPPPTPPSVRRIKEGIRIIPPTDSPE